MEHLSFCASYERNAKVLCRTAKHCRRLAAVLLLGCIWFPVLAQPTAEQVAKLVASDGNADDRFGYSVAVSGNTALVGAREADIAGKVNQGAVYVYNLVDDTWTQTAKITAGDGAAFNLFGDAVAIEGNTVVIGAPGATEGGAAYVYTLSGGSWTQTAKLTANDGATGDLFGSSTSISGNMAIVGAYGVADMDGNSFQGAAYVYTLSGGNWTQTAKLTASDGAANDYFGLSVGLSGNVAIIGAYLADANGNFDQGAAYVYTLNGSNWTQTAKLTASDEGSGTRFGLSVAVSDNLAVVGANGAGDFNQGAAYVYRLSDGSWIQTAKLVASDRSANDGLGSSVAVSGDVVVAGAYGPGNSFQGAAYVYRLSDGNWTQTAKLTASDGAVGDSFSISVALSGSVAVVGAYFADVSGNAAQGAAYVYNVSGTSTPNALRINNGSSQPVTVGSKQFIADRYVNNQGSTPRTFNTGDIAGTTEDVIYRSIRSGDKFTYFIPVPDGRYNVELNFAEVFFTQAGQRVFSVNIEGGATELVNFDVVSAAGGAKRAVSRVFPVTVRDGNLSIAFISQVSKAMISAIQITPASVARESVVSLAGDQPDLQAFPNPFTDRITVQLGSPQQGTVAVSMTDAVGRTSYQRSEVVNGTLELLLDVSKASLKPGLYFVQVTTPEGKRKVVKLLKR